MMAMTCPAEHELLPLLSQEPGASEIREHVASCSSCRQRLEQLDGEVRALRENRQDASLPPWSDLLSHVGLGLASARTDPDETAEYRPKDPIPSTTADAASSADAGPAAMPARIGKYLVVGELDDGGQATVYRVVHPGIGRDLALKLAKKRVDERETDLDLSAGEAKILGDLDHPGLVRVVDLDVHEGLMFLVMDYVRGKNLQQYATDRPVTAREAARLVIQAAEAAEAVHRRGIVHQDIKPKNILVDESGRARLIDFGLARWHDAWSHCAEGPSGGTPEFMAPEQAQGQEDRIGPRTDVFALGAVLYFLLTGQAPFQAGNRLETLARARRNDFDREALKKAGVPRRLERIVLNAMATEPESRQASAEAFARDLGSFLRRPQWLAAMAAILLLAGVSTAAWLHWPLP
jgi:tRNA A-37 threonylcarbamoyl transferase component Bud32